MSRHRALRWMTQMLPATCLAVVLGGCRGLGDAPLAPAAAEPSAAEAQAPATASSLEVSGAASGVSTAPPIPSAPRVAWRFQAAASSSGAAGVAPDGSVYVATVEGYVHALAPDGSFRWSYNLTGAALGTPAVDRAGQVYVATSEQRLYALRSDGRVAWMHRPTSKIVTDVVWSAPGTLFFGGRDRRLHALAAWGGPLWSRPLAHPFTASPASLPGGWLGVGTKEPALWLFRAGGTVKRAPLPGALSQPLMAGSEHWFAMVQEEILAFSIGDEGRVAWRARAREAALSSNGEWLVARAGRELLWLSPRTGLSTHAVALTDEPSAPPSVNDRGVAMVPLISGELFIAAPSAPPERVKVAAAPLRTPVWNERTGNAIAVGGGVAAGVELRDWPAPVAAQDSVGMAPQPADGAMQAAPSRPSRPGRPGGGA